MPADVAHRFGHTLSKIFDKNCFHTFRSNKRSARRKKRAASRTSSSSSLGFHSVHGENIRLSTDGRSAKRGESFCDGIVFSDRPVRVNEVISVKFLECSSTWSGALRFGFTNTDPIQLRTNLPKYACPELTNKPGNNAKALSERYSVPNTVLSYFCDEHGKVHYSINGEDKGIYLIDVDVSRPFWCLMDIYGFTIAIQLIDSPQPSINVKENNNNITPKNNIYMELSPREIKKEPLPQVYKNSNSSPLPFHRTRGCNVKLSSDGCLAERNDSHYSRGYVFSQRPLRIGEKMAVQVLKTDQLYAGSLAFGLTTCNPAILSGNDLPDDPHTLLDRPEYWIVIKDVANAPVAGDEIAFKITETGQVQMSVNRQPPKTLMHVDQSQSFYAFFDLYGSTIKIRSLGSIRDNQPLKQKQNLPSQSDAQDYYNLSHYVSTPRATDNTINTYGGLKPVNCTYSTIQHCRSDSEDSSSSDAAACTVCFEQPINCALYTCGHMCMCYDCAYKQWKRQGAGRCPICRARIMDVIRTYYA
ncbi:E3 ubiquitin-protein ligase neur [Brevipalpus obovatus]|uniref:E3 ubiquitin-protein ligase neur n=1 Tax=Brevipalpus obovatus TaxID=246614 RepID=UPI003D9E57C6